MYVAPTGRHLLVMGDRLRLGTGPPENFSRPAIDALFRSAALSRGGQTIGVLLTGLLDDGVAGLAAVKKSGGRTVVQDPADAAFPDMPRNALDAVEVDHVAGLAEVPALLQELTRRPTAQDARTAPPGQKVMRDLEMETRIALGTPAVFDPEQLGPPAPFTCPDCSGPLFRMPDDSIERFRCLVGHAVSAHTLAAGQRESIERALWAAARALRERARLLDKLAKDNLARAGTRAAMYAGNAREARKHSELVLSLLPATEEGPPADEDHPSLRR